MPNYNKTILIGHLTRDVQIRQLPGGSSVADFSLAVNHRWTASDGQKREEVSFIDCTAFGKTGQTIGQYLAKGDPLLVEGRLRQQRWEDKEGNKRTKMEVVVESFTFIGSRSAGDRSDSPPPQRTAARRATGTTANSQAADPERFIEESDIPF